MQAKQLLRRTGARLNERQFFNELPTVDEVRALAALLPGGVRDILSVRGNRYRELGLAGQDLTDEELIHLLAQEPWLWRRPVVMVGDRVVVGLNEEAQEELKALLS